MADVTISNLTKGIPAGSALLPYSQGGNTLAVAASSVLQGSSFVEIGAPSYPNYNYNIGTAFGPYAGGQALLTLGDFNRFDSCAIRFTQAGGSHIIGNNRPASGGAPNPILSTASNADFVINNDVRGPGTSIVLATSGIERMRIDKDGNVGIGTSNPQAKLDVSGDVRATNTAKAYAIFDGSNAINTECTVLKGYNISKIEKLGNIGEYKVTFANSVTWPYAPVTGGFNNGSGNGGWNTIAYFQTIYGYPEPSNTGFNINCYSSSGNWQSQKYISFAVF